jgi:hypothetical protein
VIFQNSNNVSSGFNFPWYKWLSSWRSRQYFLWYSKRRLWGVAYNTKKHFSSYLNFRISLLAGGSDIIIAELSALWCRCYALLPPFQIIWHKAVCLLLYWWTDNLLYLWKLTCGCFCHLGCVNMAIKYIGVY